MTHWNPPRWDPLTIFFFFKVFFQTKNFFFQEPIFFFSWNNFCLVFYVLESKKKNFGAIQKKFFENLLSNFRKEKIQKFSDRSEMLFCITVHKTLNKSCSLNKIFLFLKKKVVSLKKTSFSFFSKGHPYSIFILVF